MSVDLRIIDSLEAFENIKQDWDQLYDNCPNTTIFSSWDWMFTWWEVFSKGIKSELLILCLYENQKLIGLAPFHIIHSFPKSLIQGKTLCFIGSGEEIQDKIVSQYSDFIVESENQDKMISSISNYLLSNKGKWDFADFQFLLKDSLVSRLFEEPESQIQTQISKYGNRYFIDGMESFDEFLNETGNRWSKMYKKKSRKLINDGDKTIKTTMDFASSKNAFEQLTKMHEARWKNRKDTSIFESELFNEFHLKLLERLVPQKKAFIKTLCLNDEALASYYCFTDKSQVHYYQSGFYSENANRYSPLFLLVYEDISLAIENKTLFDFMFDEDSSSYKKEQYAAQSNPMYHLIWSPSKSTMIKYKYAKLLQTKYLKYKSIYTQKLKK